jgi:predicted nucleotidyltransferase
MNGRRQQLQDTLERILTALKAEYHPEQVIVFGSLASGQITETSDLDVLIVKKTSKQFFERVKEVIALCDYDIGVDLLVYTPEELNEAALVNPFVRDEILAKGKVVYRAAA